MAPQTELALWAGYATETLRCGRRIDLGDRGLFTGNRPHFLAVVPACEDAHIQAGWLPFLSS